MRVAAQERELELRLNLIFGRTRHAQRIGALKAFGGDIDGVLQQVDFALRFHFAQRAEICVASCTWMGGSSFASLPASSISRLTQPGSAANRTDRSALRASRSGR